MKNIWIINHYANNDYFMKSGRHYWFAKHLTNNGYKVTIFCSNILHNSNYIVKIKKKAIVLNKELDGIDFVFVKSSKYKNKLSRIFNMISFYLNLLRYIRCKNLHSKPDIIYASSVHPLAIYAGIKIKKLYQIPLISEIRDLWPESIFAYTKMSDSSIIAKILYTGEKYLYRKSDALIFTMEGGKQYLMDKKLSSINGGLIPLEIVFHINNGIDIDVYDYNALHFTIDDEDLTSNNFKIIYTGSIRRVNNINKILDIASRIAQIDSNIIFLLYGEGDEKEILVEKCKNNHITNVKFKGKVDRKYIPYILKKSNLNIMIGTNNRVFKYGISANKLFDYLASGKPTFITFKPFYSVFNEDNSFYVDNFNIDDIVDKIVKIKNLDESLLKKIMENARNTALNYDFKILGDKLIHIIKLVLRERDELE